MVAENKPEHSRNRRKYVIAFIVISLIVLLILTLALELFGPTMGVFSNVTNQLNSGSGQSSIPRTPIASSNSTTEFQIQATQQTQKLSPVQAAQTTATAIAGLFQQTPLDDVITVEVLISATQSPLTNLNNSLPQTGGGGTPLLPTPYPIPTMPPDMFFENYGVNPFLDTEDDHLSTFAVDVDTASYTLARSYLLDHQQLPDKDAIRPEEFINYFAMDYPSPENEAFALYLTAAPAPFGFEGHYLLEVGLQGRYIAPEDRQPAMLTFVIDVSGSMEGEYRLGLVKKSLELLVENLREDDEVAIVTYADVVQTVLQPTAIRNRESILNTINGLQAGGSTYAEAGLQMGYELANKNFREGAINRVILLSDGVANVGETGPDAILKTVQENVDKGITLSTIGVGMDNYNDVLMEQLANDGDGNYYYVDELREARRVFVHNLTSTLQVIAYDAKIQVDFNPDVTDRYRLIGYENRAVADNDFRNDAVDAGEIGAGHHVTALYEMALDDVTGTIATVYVRYQDADTRKIVEISQAITTDDLIASIEDSNPRWRLLASAAEFSEVLRESYWAQDGNYDAILALIEALQIEMPENGQLHELVEMVHRAQEYSN